jgi:transcriptional regulator NrdR family protein
MKCPECGTYTEVIDSRMKVDGTRRRRYQCANMHRFTTQETITKEHKCSTHILTRKTGQSG